MANWKDFEVAEVGYKVQIGDKIVMTTAFGLSKVYDVTSVKGDICIHQTKGRKLNMKFPRRYKLPYLPIQRKYSNYESPNTWHVRIANKRKLRLRYE